MGREIVTGKGMETRVCVEDKRSKTKKEVKEKVLIS